MQPFNLLRHLKTDFIDYLSSKYPFAERGMNSQDRQLRNIMSETGVLFQDPVLQIMRSRKTQVADPSMFHPSLVKNMENFQKPYEHQLKAWRNIQQEVPTVIATGTGSGKSESFIFPIIDGLLKKNFHTGSNRIGALLLYPMNALVEDQFFRILKYAKGTGIRAGIYNGTFKKPSRNFRERINKKIQTDIDPNIDPNTIYVDPNNPETIPHILLTNYKMLEYMLLRSNDQGLFNNIDLSYLVLDEAHIYTGTLGLEIACLLARLRVHIDEDAANFLPIATSATLVQQLPQHEQPSDTNQRASMHTFFSQLFGVDFPNNKDWLLADEYAELGNYHSETFAKILQIPAEKIEQELKKKFPDALVGLAHLFFGLDLTGDSAYEQWGKLIYPHVKQLARELPAVLLDSAKATTIKWQIAVEKFQKNLTGTPKHLEALLMLASHAFKDNDKLPCLGLRVHLFTKPEPRIYWSLDKQKLDREPAGNMLDFITCRRCGHQAWGAVYTPTNEGGHTSGELSPLPDFYEDRELASGQELVIFHHVDDIDASNFDKKDWSQEGWQITASGQGLLIAKLSSKKIEFIRVRRKDSKKQQANDNQSCPACGGTSSDKQRAVLSTLRSSASTDISIYGASLLTNMDLPQERRLLTFCDNRQETAFLAGFLTDRHRRLNVKRAIATFLKSDSKRKWSLLNNDEKDKNSYYDLAARILLSVEKKEFWGTKPLPDKFSLSKQTLIDLIPKDMLETDWLDRKDPATREEQEYKNWLMDNRTLSNEHDKLNIEDETEDIFKTDRGKWCLKTFSDVIFIEMTALLSRDSSLASAGVAAWGFSGLDGYELFCDYAENNQQLGLDAKGLFAIADWLLRELISRGLYLDRHTRRHVIRWQQNENENLKTIISKGLDGKGLSPNAKIYRLLKAHIKNDKNIDEWSKSRTWKNFIEQSPLEKYIQIETKESILRIKEKRVYITDDLDVYRSSKTKRIITVPRNYPLAGIATGVKDEVWDKYDVDMNNYYRNLYCRNFDEEARLIRGKEHNGMLKSEQANQVIEDFVAEKINTLVATPTLEMGVDLPDLPIVIHRSVPPDASNYAQRTGRAGRDPKRAFLLTHCGYSSHDLVFYDHPEMMVAGEILPPGLPCENISIIRRHVQGLVLELLAIKHQEFSSVLSFTRWQDLVALNDLKADLKKATGEEWGLHDCEPIDWRSILHERKDFIEDKLANFRKILRSGLWKELADVSRLEREITQAAHGWADNFKKECAGYRTIIRSHITEIERLRRSLSGSQTRDIGKQKSLIEREQLMAKSYLQGHSEHFSYPITYLCSSGFLPNFDFPGVTTRFIGTAEQYRRGNYPRKDEATMEYERGAEIALREFSPEQTIYGHNYVYKIDRYVARAADRPDDNKSWGVCLQGCTQLTDPSAKECQLCGGELVKYREEKFKQPKLIEIQQAQGHQHEIISDKSPRRQHHFATQDVRRIGILNADEALVLQDDERIKIKKYLSTDNQVQTATIICVGGGQDKRVMPVFKEIVEGNIFSVKLKISEQDQDKYEPFIPTVFGKGQAITLTMPFDAVSSYLEQVDIDGEKIFYEIFSQLFIRATHRVLRLRKRNHSLKIVLDKVHVKPSVDTDVQIEKIDIMLLDTEEGGSGVIALIWVYWDDILREAKHLATKDCCKTSCYQCVRSYDNQRVHKLLDKSIFKQENSLFDFLQRNDSNGRRYRQERVVAEDKQPESHIEDVFAKFLQKNFRGNVTQQESVSNEHGHEVTRPDFVLNAFGGEQVAIYLDGAKWHANYEKMLSDIEKRNLLAMQGRRVLSLPGKLFVPQLQTALLKAIITPLEKAITPTVLKTTTDQPPLAGMEQKTIDNLQAVKLNNMHAVDRIQLQKHPRNLFNDQALTAFLQARQVLGNDFLPAAVQGDILLFAVDGKKIFQDNTCERWAQYLILTSLFATLGYRIIGCWLGARKR